MGYTSMDAQVFEERVKKIRHQLQVDSLEGLLIFTDEFRPHYSLYISDYRPVENIEISPQGIYISQVEIVLFLGEKNMENAKETSWIRDVRNIEEISSFFLEMEEGVCIGLSGIEKIPYFYKKIIDKIAINIQFFAYDHRIDALRVIKNTDEIKLMKEASAIADQAIKEMLKNVCPDKISEVELATIGEYFIRKSGMDYGYDTIVASGKNTMDKTWRPSHNIIKRGDILLINIIPRNKGYCSFVTISQAIENSYAHKICDISKKIIHYVIENLRQGDGSDKIYRLYYKKVKEYGLLEHFLPFSDSDTSIGHSTGLEVVEPPYLDIKKNVILEKNMILSLKFNLYNFDFGDIRFEFNVLMEDKAVLLNKCL
jgi:Xaa-Pro aminopeptidase